MQDLLSRTPPGADVALRFHPTVKVLAMLAGAVAFVVAGLWMMRSGEVVAGLLSVVFFGACGLVALWRLVRHGVALRITQDGIDDHTGPFAVGFIPWSQVVEAVPARAAKDASFVGVVVRDPRRVLRPLNAATRRAVEVNMQIMRPTTPVWLNPLGLSTTADDLADFINVRLAEWQRRHPQG